MHDIRLTAVFITYELCKPDELLFVECANKYAALEECGAHPSDGVDVLATVGERFPLPKGNLVINLMDPFD